MNNSRKSHRQGGVNKINRPVSKHEDYEIIYISPKLLIHNIYLFVSTGRKASIERLGDVKLKTKIVWRVEYDEEINRNGYSKVINKKNTRVTETSKRLDEIFKFNYILYAGYCSVR